MACYLYGVDWSDPTLYDLVINLERTTITEACNAVGTMILEPSFQVTPSSQAAMEDLALASRVRATLAVHQETDGLALEVGDPRGRRDGSRKGAPSQAVAAGGEPHPGNPE
ncbi:MAG: hypothetical protein WBM29_05225 [Candidatus Deferrimicrobium sp.]